MNSGFFPIINPNNFKRPQLSESYKTPYYFGGSQVPFNLNLENPNIRGSGLNFVDSNDYKNNKKHKYYIKKN